MPSLACFFGPCYLKHSYFFVRPNVDTEQWFNAILQTFNMTQNYLLPNAAAFSMSSSLKEVIR